MKIENRKENKDMLLYDEEEVINIQFMKIIMVHTL